MTNVPTQAHLRTTCCAVIVRFWSCFPRPTRTRARVPVDASGQGRLLLNDRDWVVVSQSPAGGTTAVLDTKILLRSKKIGE
jgi:hypothetical protein